MATTTRDFLRSEWPSLPAFCDTVEAEVTEVRLVHEGRVLFTVNPQQELWWRSDLATANGKVFLAELSTDGDD